MKKPPKVLIRTWLQLVIYHEEGVMNEDIKAARQRALNNLLSFFDNLDVAQAYLEQEDAESKAPLIEKCV